MSSYYLLELQTSRQQSDISIKVMLLIEYIYVFFLLTNKQANRGIQGFRTQPSLGFRETGVKKRKCPVSGSYLAESALLMQSSEEKDKSK